MLAFLPLRQAVEHVPPRSGAWRLERFCSRLQPAGGFKGEINVKDDCCNPCMHMSAFSKEDWGAKGEIIPAMRNTFVEEVY